MSLYGVDLLVGWLTRLPHVTATERDEIVQAIRAPEALLALDHLPEIAALHARFVADPAAAAPLASALAQLRASHDQAALDACRRDLATWVRARASSRADAEAIATRWPPVAREQIDFCALERWLRDGAADGLLAGSQLTQRAADVGHGMPRTFTAQLGTTHAGIEEIAASWARVIEPAFTLEGATRVTLPSAPARTRGRREATLVGPRFALVTAESSWLDGPGETLQAWDAFARPLGVAPDVWLLARTEGNEESGDVLRLECSAPEPVLAALATRFAACRADGTPE